MAGKHYTDEFKKSIVHLYINRKPIEEIQSEYGISKSTFFAYIEGWYNRTGLHSSIGYRTPVQFENELKMDKNVVNEVEVKSTSFCV